MKWATRAGCHVDRAACAWLIHRFIDPQAQFVFVEDPDEIAADATPFDVADVPLSHHGGACSFEAFLTHYRLDDAVLREIARIVHEADLADERYDAPEAPGLDVLIRGLGIVHGDAELIEIAARLFDGLYAYIERALALGRRSS